MPALNFKKEFVPKIQSGEKTFTIRKVRKHPIKSGDNLALYTGMRTKNCYKIADAKCRFVKTVYIHKGLVVLSGSRLNKKEIEQFATSDGFDSADRFYEFFESQYGSPFSGVVIIWEKPTT